MNLPQAESWHFSVSESNGPERYCSLKGGSLFLGSSPDCTIACTSDGIDPQHAEFVAIDGTLHVRILGGAAHVFRDGQPLQGTVALDCPASLHCGSLRISITVHAAPPPKPNPDSTLRLVHPGRTNFPQITEPENVDITARIVHRLPGAENASPEATSFSEESTMAFSMEPLDIALEENIPVRTDYTVKEEIARGGMGKIYSARDAKLERLVALKVSTVGDRSVEPQFFREAKTLAALEHPNVVPIHNLGTASEDRPFYSMKLVHGQTLQSIIKRLATGDPATVAAFSRARLLDVFRKVCDAVAFAHSKGYLHRDLKPDNIMVGEFGEVLVMDWGIAKKIRRSTHPSDTEDHAAPEPETLSYIEGTPQYMSPEQANGLYGGLDERSDVYSLGGILYAILTLRPPVSGASLSEVLDKVRKGETTTMAMPSGSVQPGIPAHGGRAVPEALRAVTVKAMAKERERRYQSVGELTHDIEAYQSGFATIAEDASLFRQIWLLMKRHKLVSAMLFLLACGTVLFSVRLAASERVAIASEKKALREAEAARESEARANLTLAEVAEQTQNADETLRILKRIPKKLQNQEWEYISRVADSAEKTITLKDLTPWYECAPHPKDPDLLFTLHQDGWIRTVNLATGDVKDIVNTGLKPEARSNFAISPNGDTAAVCAFTSSETRAWQMELKLIDLRTGTARTLTKLSPDTATHYTPKQYLEFNPQGTVLLAQTVTPPAFQTFDVETATMLRFWPDDGYIQGPYDQGISRFSPDGLSVIASRPRAYPDRILLTGGTSASNSKLRDIIPRPDLMVFLDQKDRALGLANDVLKKWDTRSGETIFETRLTDRSFQGGQFLRTNQLAHLPGPNLAVALTSISDDAAALLIIEDNRGTLISTRLVTLERNTTTETDWRLVTHPLSNRIALARGRSIKVWKLSQPQPKSDFKVLGWSVWDAFSFVDGPSKAVTARQAAERHPEKTEVLLEVLDLDENQNGRTVSSGSLTISRDPGRYVYISTNADGKRMGAKFTLDNGGPKDDGGLFVVWNVRNGILSEFQRLEVKGYPWDVQLSPSGNLLWTSKGAVEIASKQNLEKTDRKGISDPVDKIQAVWAGESRVAEIKLLRQDPADAHSKSERVILTWDVATGRRETAQSARDAISLDASPDGTLLVEGGSDMRVRFRNAATLQVTKTLRVHDGPVTSVAWHPSLPLLATGSSDRSVKIWDLRSDKPVKPLEEFQYLSDSLPCKLKWSPDGKLLAVSETAATPVVKVYEPEACKRAR